MVSWHITNELNQFGLSFRKSGDFESVLYGIAVDGQKRTIRKSAFYVASVDVKLAGYEFVHSKTSDFVLFISSEEKADRALRWHHSLWKTI